MTDSVTKNLQVEHLVAEELGSDHIPPHTPPQSRCKFHISLIFSKDLKLNSYLIVVNKWI